MAATETLSIRLEPALRTQLNEAAEHSGTTISDLVVRAIGEHLALTCGSCGRPYRLSPTPAGLTDAFITWMAGLSDHDRSHIFFVVSDPTLGPTVYRGELNSRAIERARTDGYFFLVLSVPGLDQSIPVAIFRSLLLTWGTFDNENHWNIVRSFGLNAAVKDGNQILARQLVVPKLPPQARRR